MRNKILGIALCTAGMIAVSSCSDYLETNSPSTITSEVAAASLSGCQTTLDGAYTNFHAVLRDQIFANGLFYALDAAGSDIERHGGEQNVGRLRAETFYNGGNSEILSNFSVETDLGTADAKTAYSLLYRIISTMNVLINGITEDKLADNNQGEEYKSVLAQAILMRATCYRELIKYYGDVFLIHSSDDGVVPFSSRLDIYDELIEQVSKIKDTS